LYLNIFVFLIILFIKKTYVFKIIKTLYYFKVVLLLLLLIVWLRFVMLIWFVCLMEAS